MGAPPYKGAKRLLIDTTHCDGDAYEEIDRDRIIPNMLIPSAKYKKGYDQIDWSKGRPEKKEDAES